MSERIEQPSQKLPRPLNFPRSRTSPEEPPDVTLLNLGLMLVNASGSYDQQAYLPLGPLYIAACLEREGYNVELADYQVFSAARTFDANDLVEGLSNPAPVIGISCMSNLLPYTIHVAEKLKDRYPDRQIVLGGVGPSPVAREIIEAFPFVDAVIEGEGEISMLDFVRNGKRGHIPPQVPTRLDDLPLPAYSLIDFDLYDAAPSVITSRGCPFQCTFCTEPYNFGGHVRFRDVDSVMEEIELLHGLSGKDMFLFQDDILPLKPSRFRRMAAGFRNRSFPLKWKCFGRVDLMTEDIMREMVESGCVQIRYGVESGSNKTLQRIKKGFTIERAYEVAVKSLEYFPTVHASFIWGYPFEEISDMEDTLDWVTRFEDAGISVLLFEFSPLPGSPLYKEHRDKLIFSKERYSFYVVTGHEIVHREGYRSSETFEPVYRLIEEHPSIFSGFYQYEGTLALAQRQRLEQYRVNRRTKIKGEYDL